VDQATFPPDDCPPCDVLAFVRSHDGDDRLDRSPEALDDVVEPILAAVRDGGRPRSEVWSPRTTRVSRAPKRERA
jgi:hypothetical protein